MSFLNVLDGYIGNAFNHLGSAVMIIPVIGDGLHAIDNLAVGARRSTEVVRDYSPKVIRSVAEVVEEAPKVVKSAESLLQSPMVLLGVGGLALFLMRD